jgi:hypothetical protein
MKEMDSTQKGAHFMTGREQSRDQLGQAESPAHFRGSSGLFADGARRAGKATNSAEVLTKCSAERHCAWRRVKETM